MVRTLDFVLALIPRTVPSLVIEKKNSEAKTLCCHALRIYSIHRGKETHEKYILKRWTRVGRPKVDIQLCCENHIILLPSSIWRALMLKNF